MKLVVISHKRFWKPTGGEEYLTIGGFPFQMEYLSALFDQSTVIGVHTQLRAPNDLTPLAGNNLSLKVLPEPKGRNFWRKLALPFWLARYLPVLWGEIHRADAVHAPVPGDIGTIGLLIALFQGKPVFVRHCGTWGNRTTLADRFLDWLLPRIAGGKNVVMATGGGDVLPCPKNANIAWIFSTTLSQKEWEAIPQAEPWEPGHPLRLVNVGRLSAGKNTAAVLRSVAKICEQDIDIHLDVLGEGPELQNLVKLADTLNLSDQIVFHGNVSHQSVLQMLSQAHLMVFPTHTKEGFPKVVIEAFACGLPVIATRVSVIPHLIENCCGMVLDQTDPDSVAKAVLKLLSNPSQLAAMGKRARETSRKYTLENWRDRIGERLESAWGSLKSDG